nr:MAG TPA: hypothetical protein [Caudoviricetes sp.]
MRISGAKAGQVSSVGSIPTPATIKLIARWKRKK